MKQMRKIYLYGVINYYFLMYLFFLMCLFEK